MGSGDGSKAARHAAKDAQAQRWILQERRLEVPGGQRETAGGSVGCHLGVARQLVQHRELPEELAGPEVSDRRTVLDHPDATFHDDEEPGADLSMPNDHRPGRVVHFGGMGSKRRQPLGAHPTEQRAARQQIGATIVGQGHRLSIEHTLGPMLRPAVEAVNPRQVDHA